MGILTIAAVLAGYLYPRLRLVEDELPDAEVKIAPDENKPAGQDLSGVQPQVEHA